jgi:hypothetical protein
MKSKDLSHLLEYLFEQYIFQEQTQNTILQALTVIKIVSMYAHQSLGIYLESLFPFFKSEANNLPEISDDAMNFLSLENKIKKVCCEIFTIAIEKDKIKPKLVTSLEAFLITIILTKPSHVMLPALE